MTLDEAVAEVESSLGYAYDYFEADFELQPQIEVLEEAWEVVLNNLEKETSNV